tara:strand:+ start:388 stop:903 length:516 start_codon:yes stop_codon:yes gene_type:complete
MKKRTVSWLGGALMMLSLVRTSVLVAESMAAVRDERQADDELLQLCRSGAARASTKMRAACLKARSDAASPLLFKAIVRSVSTAWGEFIGLVSTPYGVATMLLFLLSSFVLPIVPWIKVLGRAAIHDEGEDDLESERHVIVLSGGGGHVSSGGSRRRVSARLEGPSGWVDA